MTKVKRPAVPRPEPKYLTGDELKRLLDYLARDGDPRELAVQLMVRLGLRRGEALGLTWADVDLDTGRISVALQLQRIPDPSDPALHVLSRVPLKTAASRRSVRATGTLLERLRQLHTSSHPPDGEFLVQLGRRPVDPQNLTQWLSTRSKEVGITCSPHRLRHTAATLMLNETGSIATVSSFPRTHRAPDDQRLREGALEHERRRGRSARRRGGPAVNRGELEGRSADHKHPLKHPLEHALFERYAYFTRTSLHETDRKPWRRRDSNPRTS